MPLLKASIKDVRKTKKRTLLNNSRRSRIRTMLKKLRSVKSAEEARKLYAMVEPMLDKAAKTNLFHKNKAARLKSRLKKHISGLDKK